ncbi:MAG: hypothetical protein MJZ98_05250 [Paludibacteraceae bacterium]|nr:hypothetical protein [Paludibacteraceae bacterium]
MEEEKRSSLLKFVYPYEDLNKVVIKADWANGKCGAMIVRKEIDGYQAHFVSFNYNEEMDVLLNDNPKKAFQITEQKIGGGSLVAVGFLGHLLANYQMLLECRKSAVDVYKEYFDYRINAFDAEQQSKPMQKRLTRADFVRQHLKNEGLAFDYSKSQKLFSFFTLEDTFLLLDYLWDYMLYFKDNSGCIFSIEKRLCIRWY